MSRLNDTRAIVDLPLRDGYGEEKDKHWTRGSNPIKRLPSAEGDRGLFPADPDAGRAVTARRDIPGRMQYSYDWDEGDIVGKSRPHPDAGCEKASEISGAFKSSAKVKGYRR